MTKGMAPAAVGRPLPYVAILRRWQRRGCRSGWRRVRRLGLPDRQRQQARLLHAHMPLQLPTQRRIRGRHCLLTGGA